MEEYQEIPNDEALEIAQTNKQLDKRRIHYDAYINLVAKYFRISPHDINAVRVTIDGPDKPIKLSFSFSEGVTRTFIEELIDDGKFSVTHEFLEEIYHTPSHRFTSYVPIQVEGLLQSRWWDCSSPFEYVNHSQRESGIGMKMFDGSYWKDMLTRLSYDYLNQMGYSTRAPSVLNISPSSFEQVKLYRSVEVEAPLFEVFTE